MSNEADVRAYSLLEQAVHKAQKSLELTKHFQPFMMLLTDDGEVENYENNNEDASISYSLLEDTLVQRLKKRNDVDIIILVQDTVIPEQFTEGVSSSIRLHLEEKSQISKKIGARFLYVPYEMCQVAKSDMIVRLYAPVPVGFPAEYITGS